MVKRKPQAVGGAMPATGAGLIRYFDEDEGGLKIRPEVVVGICVIVIVAGILLQILVQSYWLLVQLRLVLFLNSLLNFLNGFSLLKFSVEGLSFLSM